MRQICFIILFTIQFHRFHVTIFGTYFWSLNNQIFTIFKMYYHFLKIRCSKNILVYIIILDEATSALDNESEFAVAKSLGELSEGRTTLTIAHRLSSIRNSDRILVLTDDGIVEEGNHDQLMEQKGIYYQFYETANALK